MKVVDFYKLPRAIQDRFVGSVMSGFPPAPLLVSKGGAPTKFLWLGLSGVSFVVLVVVARLGFGGLDSSLSLHTAKAVPLYIALVFGIAFGLVMAFARVVRERALPYASGVYLFPACVIDARDDRFRVYPTSDLKSVVPQGAGVRVAFGSGFDFVFPLVKADAAQAVVAEIESARERAMHAAATEDAKELVAVDPLHNPRFSSPVGPRDPHAIAEPPWGKLGPVVAGVLAVVIGPTLFMLRNRGSEQRMYAIATQRNDTESYRQYMAHGERFADEVGTILLPRSELHDAERQGTVDALLAYKKSHPDSKIAGEVASSIRRAMLAELEKAKAQGSLAALQKFAARYPEHGIQPELNAATHAVYARELDAYKKKAPSKDKAAASFIERLFAYAEKHGPKVDVRFRRKAPATMERADQFILKTPTFMGVATYPSRFFDDKHAPPREAALGKSLATQFGTGLAPELFQVEIGALVTEPEVPEPTVPTLFVTHVAEWSGHNYTSTRPRGSYIGVIFTFDASFVIPGDGKPYKFKTDIFKHAATQVLNNPDEPMLAPGQAEEKVYATMAEDAFEQFGKKLLANFFAPPPSK